MCLCGQPPNPQFTFLLSSIFPISCPPCPKTSENKSQHLKSTRCAPGYAPGAVLQVVLNAECGSWHGRERCVKEESESLDFMFCLRSHRGSGRAQMQSRAVRLHREIFWVFVVQCDQCCSPTLGCWRGLSQEPGQFTFISPALALLLMKPREPKCPQESHRQVNCLWPPPLAEGQPLPVTAILSHPAQPLESKQPLG